MTQISDKLARLREEKKRLDSLSKSIGNLKESTKEVKKPIKKSPPKKVLKKPVKKNIPVNKPVQEIKTPVVKKSVPVAKPVARPAVQQPAVQKSINPVEQKVETKPVIEKKVVTDQPKVELHKPSLKPAASGIELSAFAKPGSVTEQPKLEIPEETKPESKSEHKQVEKAEIKHDTPFAKKPEPKKKRLGSYDRKRFFSSFIRKAGVEADFDDINKKIVLFAVILTLLTSLYYIIESLIKNAFLLDILSVFGSVWLIGLPALYFACWLLFLVYIDLSVNKRKKEIERVFPDFLQLTAANINAGMPIDRALWFAIRPRFGILSTEMEKVAKKTMVGEKLDVALTEFADIYDSITVKRALNLLLEGLQSGGELGDLLIRIADNIREIEIIKKEMAASVTTYTIFILFATLGAAPFLFGLTTQLIVIMTSIMSQVSLSSGGASVSGFGSFLSGGGESISLSDYRIFATLSIILSSTFAAIIIAIITKGEVKEALTKIPVYVIIGLVNYQIAFGFMTLLLGNMF